MDIVWAAKQKVKYENDLLERKKKIQDSIETSNYITPEKKKDFLKALEELEKDPYSISLSFDLVNYYFDIIEGLGNNESEDELMLGLDKWNKWVSSLEIDNYRLRLHYPESYNGSRYIDSEPMEFDGDIIITDPCYIIKEKDYSSRPDIKDYFVYESIKDYPDYDGETSELWTRARNAYDKAYDRWKEDNPDDWNICNCGYNMEALGIKTYMTRDTIYGDWSCTTYDTDTGQPIGNFCADAGLVSVFLLDEVLKYNPEFDYHTQKSWAATWIKDFKGTVQFVVTRHEGVCEEFEVEVHGHGVNKATGEPINFVGKQTGL